MKNLKFATVLAVMLGVGTANYVDAGTAEADKVKKMSAEISLLMTDMQERSKKYPDVMQKLLKGQASLEQADETVSTLIKELTEIADKMADGSDFDNAIDEYVGSTISLIGDAQSSNNEQIKALLPSLNSTKETLEGSDARRAEAVILARTAVRELEKNREAIVFFIKAGAVTEAAQIISENIDEFENIVARAQAVAEGLIEGTNQ